MLGKRSWLLLLCCLLVAHRSFVSSAPHGDSTGGGSGGTDSTQDENVKELERLKPGGGRSVAVIKTHSSVFANINGKKEQHSQTKEEVEKNGEVLARLSQQVDKSGGVEPHVKTSLDIPSRNIHRVMEQGPKEVEQEVKRNFLVSKPTYNSEAPNPASSLHYSPLDMAEYIFWTGDEKGVASAIEDFLQDGQMSRETAIGFLQDVKQNLDYLQTHYMEDRYRNQPQVKDKLEDRGSSELSEVRQQMEEHLIKKADFQDSSLPMQIGDLMDQDYEEILDRIRTEDLMYNEYSLEEIIYQLAKLLFTQTLSRGSTEAQDALQKFTTFLESQAQQGKISRRLEKNVLDILIASLSDTLTEHPELVNTARESLGIGLTNDQLVQQYIAKQKPGSGKKNGSMDVKSHHSEGIPAIKVKKTLQNSGLQDQENISN